MNTIPSQRGPSVPAQHNEPLVPTCGSVGANDTSETIDLERQRSDTAACSSSSQRLKEPINSISMSRSYRSRRCEHSPSSSESASTYAGYTSSVRRLTPSQSSASECSFTSNIMAPPPVPIRTFAPGLALRKPKVDPYDPERQMVPKNEFSFLANKESPRVQGTWSVIDPEGGKRHWDKAFESEKLEEQRAKSEGRSYSRTRQACHASRNPWARLATLECNDFGDKKSSTSFREPRSNSNFDASDWRFEDPNLDVDPEVRDSFIDPRYVLREHEKPLSAFEQRNKAILVHDTANPIKVIIGGQLVNTLDPKIDRRAEMRDKDGRYIDGKNRGKMKKRYEDEWKNRLAERDEQMVQATNEKRAWMALSPEERERRLQKSERNQQLVALLGAGIDGKENPDIYEYEGIPAIYRRTVDYDSIISWSTASECETSSGARNSAEHWGPLTALQDEEPSDFSMFEGGKRTSIQHGYQRAERIHSKDDPARRGRPSLERDSRQSSLSAATQSQSYSSAHSAASSAYPGRSRSTVRAVAPSQKYLSRTSTPDTRSSALLLVNSETTTAPAYENDIELAPPQNLTRLRDDFQDNGDGTVERFENVKVSCTKRGRIVSVQLHEPVTYTTSAVVVRVFAGKIQEIQYFPAERMALVVFLFPHEAASLVRHVQNVRENDRNGYRALQVEVDWYRGLELNAIYPAQKHVLAAAMAEKASRVLLINKISKKITTSQLAHDMKLCFPNKLLVKVAIATPKKRYVAKRDGNMGIVEFTSIRDAVEVMERFKAGAIAGYRECEVEYLADSCERAPTKMPYCDCLSCSE